jgi:hypothetical protein
VPYLPLNELGRPQNPPQNPSQARPQNPPQSLPQAGGNR